MSDVTHDVVNNVTIDATLMWQHDVLWNVRKCDEVRCDVACWNRPSYMWFVGQLLYCCRVGAAVGASGCAGAGTGAGVGAGVGDNADD